MALFRRKKNQDILPDEVKDYYKAEQRDRMGMAWLVAAGGFLVTIAIVLGLFFAGRWAFTTFFDSGTPEPVSEVEQTESEDDVEDGLPPATETQEDETDSQDATDAVEDEAPADRATEAADELPRTGPIAE